MNRNNKPGRIVKGTAKQPSLKDASGVWTLDEAMQAHRANAWPQPDLFQPIPNSLRMSRAKVSYLTKSSTPRDGSLMAGTFSFWMKPSTFYGASADSAYQLYQTAYTGSSNWRSLISSTGADYSQLYFAGYNGAGTLAAEIYPTWGLKDISAWYHIVLAFDTTQPTAANRFKMYVNGVQITTFSSATYPAQNTQLGFFKSGLDRYLIGINRQLANPYYDGYLAEFNAVDGYGLQPSMFGKFDSNNTWVPVPYTGTYGTNGFYLPFTNATTSQTLGYDAGFNGTATYDADQDPYRGSVALHLTGNGPAGGNNNVFADSSSTNNSITRTGSITQGSFSPFPMQSNTAYNPATHGASAYFPKSGWLSAPTAAVSSLGTGDFTFESWVYPINFTTTILFQRWFSFGTGLSNDVTVNIDTSGTLVFRIDDAIQLSSATTLTANAWNHVAFVRSSGTVRFYINGVSGNSASVTTDLTTRGSNAIIIGAEPGQSQGSAGDFFGYMSNFRVVKGTAVYTANFTPTNRPLGTLTNNLITFSENFTSAWWASNTSNTEGTAIAPDGTPSATTLIAGTYPVIAGVGSSTVAVTGSIYAKANVGNQLTFRLNRYGSGADYVEVIFNLTTGTATGATTAGTASGLVTSIVNVGNGWWRCVVSGTTSTTGGAISFNPNPTSGSIFIWGAQLETGGTATTYTPTPANFSTAPSLLLNFANAAVVDSAGANNITTVGSATITGASKYGSGALAFSGSTSNYFLTNPGSQFEPGSQDFTVEFWWYPISTGRQWFYHATTDYWFAVDYSSVSTNQKMGMWASSNGSSWNMINSDSGGNGICNTVVPQNQWNHIAYTRNNTTFRLFLNGKLDGIVSASGSIVDRSSQAKYIGTWAGAGGGAPAVNGSIDDFRFTKGIARYTADFVPPARALPETGGKSFTTVNINAGVVRSFTTTGTTAWTAPSDVTQVEVLVVAGGGQGGNIAGGGAGGVIYNNSYPVTPGQTYTVTVGAGATVPPGNGAGSNGGNSVFGSLTAIGGGGGAGNTPYNGFTGGSGGAGGGDNGTNGSGGAGTAGQGFAGGTSLTTGTNFGGGGGGGAGGPGSNASTINVAGAGGNGLNFSIVGTPTFYAGGGGGGAYIISSTGTNAAGGSGIGGSGGKNGTNATNGTVNTGSGGGGNGLNSSGNLQGSAGTGGSGVVIVRYTTTAMGNTSDTTTDNLVDSPTQYGHDYGNGGEVVGNYCTWSPLPIVNYGDGVSYKSTLSNGNLTASFGSQFSWAYGSIGVPANAKTYIEYTINSYTSTGNGWIGFSDVASLGVYFGVTVNGSVYIGDGSYNVNNSPGFATGDILGFAIDRIGNTLTLYKNGSQVYNVALAYGITSSTVLLPAVWTRASGDQVSLNAGQRPWAYAPPAGYNALTTKNFARLTAGTPAANPNQYFDAVTYTGTGAAQTITLPGAFQPDLVWMKARSAGDNHVLMDSVRGTSAALFSDLTNAEVTNATRITSFNSNGFTLGTSASVNTSSTTYVAWCWRAGGAPVSNTSGTIASQVSANTASGFSIVTYTGTGVAATVGHGLGTALSMVTVKQRNGVNNWPTWHTGLTGGNGYYVYWDSTNGLGTSSTVFNGTNPTSSVFSVGTNSLTNGSTNTYVAYCWTEIPGFSKFGTYVGNASTTDGAFIYCGFRPRFVMIKDSTNAATQWHMMDSARNAFNPVNARLMANLANAENAQSMVDFTSTGFKIRDPNGVINISAANLIFMAFAEKPFGNVNGTAR